MYLIVDISGANFHRAGLKISEGQEPTFIHDYKEDAERELLRLSKLHPGEFVLFEAVSRPVRTMTDRRVWIVEPIDMMGARIL